MADTSPPPTQRLSALRWFGTALLTAAAYFVTGRLGLLLAVPPGFATAVWPPSGIAFAAVLRFGSPAAAGVWLGSALVNVSTGYDPGTPWASLGLVALIATGSTLQAIVGARLTNWLVGYPNRLLHVRDVAVFFTVGGPAACLIAASVGVSVLWLTGRVAPGDVAFNWWTWWVGDSIGVLTLSAVVLIWFEPATTVRSRRWIVTAPVALAAALVIALFFYASSRERERIAGEFDQHAAATAAAIRLRLNNSVEALHLLRLTAHGGVTFSEAEFRLAATDLLSRRPELQALSWNLRLPEAAPSAGFPVTWIEPRQGNSGAVGFDVRGEPERRRATDRACATGDAAATSALRLRQNEGWRGVVVFLPIYGSGHTAGVGCEQGVTGLVAAVIRPDMLVGSRTGADAAELRIDLVDRSADGAPLLVSEGRGPEAPAAIVHPYVTDLALADRVWTLRVAPTPAFLTARRSLQAWNALAGGLLFTSALTCILLVVTGRTELIEQTVRDRTEALRRANETLNTLSHEADDRARAAEAAAAALAVSESRNRAVFDQPAAGIVELAPTGRILRANHRFAELVGRPVDALVGMPLAEITHPDDQESDRRSLAAGLRDELPREGWTKRYVRPDGVVAWVHVSRALVRNAAGEPDYLVGVVHDVTSSIQAERALARSRSRLLSFVEHTPAAIAMLDRDLRYVAVSRRWREDYRLETADLVGKHHYDVFPEMREMANWHAVHQRCLAGGVEVQEEDHFVRADGRDEWIKWEVRPWYDEHDAIGGIIMFTEVITPRKLAARALLESREQLQLALSNSRHGLWDWNPVTNASVHDDAWAAIMGYLPGELPAHYATWEQSIHPDDRARIQAVLERHLASDEALFDVDYRARKKNGDWAWINSRGRVQARDDAGKPLRMIGTIHDITSRKQAEATLTQSLAEKEVLLREVHHRVKNNLAVMSSLFFLQSTYTSDPSVLALLEDSRSRIQSMSLVHELLYRSDNLAAVDFAAYVSSLTHQLVASMATSVAVALDVTTHPMSVHIDTAIPCGLILNEMLTNALKHGLKGRSSGALRVVLDTGASGARTLRVSDDGVGLQNVDLTRTSSLGMRLMRSLAEQVGGGITFTSAGAGTTAELTF